MKKFATLLFLMVFHFGFTQNIFEAMHENTSEIHFTYQQKTNIEFSAKGFYTSEAFLKKNFPKLKFSKKTSDLHKDYNVFVALEDLDNKSKKLLASLLYHENEIYKAVYDVKKNTTVINATRNDTNLKIFLRTHLNADYQEFVYQEELDYNKNVKIISYPSKAAEIEFNKIQRELIYNTETAGSYVGRSKKNIYKNQVLLDKNLPKQVSLGEVFANNNFGITKIESVNTITELLSVHYK